MGRRRELVIERKTFVLEDFRREKMKFSVFTKSSHVFIYLFYEQVEWVWKCLHMVVDDAQLFGSLGVRNTLRINVRSRNGGTFIVLELNIASSEHQNIVICIPAGKQRRYWKSMEEAVMSSLSHVAYTSSPKVVSQSFGEVRRIAIVQGFDDDVLDLRLAGIFLEAKVEDFCDQCLIHLQRILRLHAKLEWSSVSAPKVVSSLPIDVFTEYHISQSR